jgi:hypothetical protein
LFAGEFTFPGPVTVGRSPHCPRAVIARLHPTDGVITVLATDRGARDRPAMPASPC